MSLTIRTWWGYSYGRTAAPHEQKRDDGDTDCDGGGSRPLLVPRGLSQASNGVDPLSSEATRAHLMGLGAAHADAGLPAVHANSNGEWLASILRELLGPSSQVLAPIARPSKHLGR
jgi:hypothetical protein